MPWHLYIIECKDGKFYTGITTDLKRRIRDHNSGNGCRFTKYRAPVKLVYSEDCTTRPLALKREAAIKRLTRKQKLELVGNLSTPAYRIAGCSASCGKAAIKRLTRSEKLALIAR